MSEFLASSANEAIPPEAVRPNVPSKDAVAASAGRLQKTLFVVESRAAQGFTPLKQNLNDHLTYLGTLEDSGKLFLAGPLFEEDPDSWSGDGLLIYNVASYEEARGIAANDPLHLSGARVYKLRQWLVNDGSLTLTLRLSNQQGDLT